MSYLPIFVRIYAFLISCLTEEDLFTTYQHFPFKVEKMLLMIFLDLCDSPAFLFIIFYWLSFYHDILKEIYESREQYSALIQLS